MNSFAVVEADRIAPVSPGRADRSRYVDRLREPIKELDFVIDSVSLREQIRTLPVPRPDIFGLDPFDMLGVANLAWPSEAASALRQLAGVEARSDDWPLTPGRLPLYVCEMCADLGCGAITVEVAQHQGAVVWSDFLMENGYTEQSEMIDLSALKPMTFDEHAYRDALLGPIPVLEALAANDAEAERLWRSRRGARGMFRRLLHRE